jgi:E3 ubiquitin-protein ligase MGRN1
MGAGASHEAPGGVQDGMFHGPPRPTLGQRPNHGHNPMLVVASPTEGSTLLPTRQFDSAPQRDNPPMPVAYQAPVQTRAVVANVINLKKSTLKLVQSSQDSSVYLVEFEFFAKVDGFIAVYYAATHDVHEIASVGESPIEKVSFSGLHEKHPSKTKFSAGTHQRYRQKLDKGLDVSKYSTADLYYKEGSKRYPVVIRLEAVFPDDSPTPEELRVKTQTTFVTLVPCSNGGFACQVLRQEVLVGGTIYAMQELYGIAGEVKASRSPSKSLQNPDTAVRNLDVGSGLEYSIEKGHECVICLTESCTTAVIPCNHLCLCDDCGDKLGSDANCERRRCPICRAPLTSLLRIIGSRAARCHAEDPESGLSRKGMHEPNVGTGAMGSLISSLGPDNVRKTLPQSPSLSGQVIEQTDSSVSRQGLSIIEDGSSSALLGHSSALVDDIPNSRQQSADGTIAHVDREVRESSALV